MVLLCGFQWPKTRTLGFFPIWALWGLDVKTGEKLWEYGVDKPVWNLTPLFPGAPRQPAVFSIFLFTPLFAEGYIDDMIYDMIWFSNMNYDIILKCPQVYS